jgi:aspartyl-tRNA synthetase
MQTELKRTHNIEQIIAAPIGAPATLMGWVDSRRDLGQLIFIILRDRWGTLQCTIDPERSPSAHKAAAELRGEYVVAFTGATRPRPVKEVRDYPGGDREFIVDACAIISRAETPPFVIEDEVKASEEMRLKYRYLDLRRRKMVEIMTVRHKTIAAIRAHLNSLGFLEVETPLLARSTPEGARDYVVPSRVQPGKFYALPQSPQLFKQILMCGGIDRYYQIAKCLRDEDLRGNRQPEHTQLDLEMSFASRDDLFEVIEGCMNEVWKATKGVELELPFSRLNYDEVLRRWGSDKPELRFGSEITDLTELWRGTGASFIAGGLDAGQRVHGVFIPGASLSRKELDAWTEVAKSLGAGGLMTVELGGDELRGSVAKFVPDVEKFKAAAGSGTGTWFMVLGSVKANLKIMGQLRLKLGHEFKLIDASRFEWLWVVDFPLYEEDETTGEVTPAHHAFTSPLSEDVDKLLSGDQQVLLSMRADNYDLVLNGTEMLSGSLRIFDPGLQRKVLRKVGLTDAVIDERFGWFLEAYKYGAPPHRGIGQGIDRLVMSLLGLDNIRDVIAFPKTATAQCPLTGAPSEIEDGQWRELGLKPAKG